MKKLLCLSLLCGIAAWASIATVQAADEKAPAGEKPKKTAADRPVPFVGKLKAVDKSAKTITVGERVFHVTSETKIMKDEKPATLDDGKVDEQVRGSYKSAEGKMNAISIFFGAKAPAKPKEPESK